MQKYELFVGIDISKNWFDAAITLGSNKKTMLHKRFDNNQSGFNDFLKWLKQQAKKMKKTGSWLVCMEHTGVYTLELCVFLEKQAIDYLIESALRIKRSLGIRRGKDDKADSKDIALYIYKNHKDLKISKLPAKELVRLKSLLTFRALLVKQRTAQKNAANSYKKMPDEYALELIVEQSQQLIKTLDEQIKVLEKQMKQIIEENEPLLVLYDLVVSVKGIGLIIGVTMLVYTNGFTAFDNARKFACYIGIAPFKEESGKATNSVAKVSALGHKKIKALIGNGVNAAIQHDPQIRAYYKRKLAEGKNEFKVKNAIKNKLIAHIFATVKRGTPYVVLANHG